MRKVILPSTIESDVVYFENISEDTPIFAKKDGKFAGMIVKETAGWITRTWSYHGITYGHHNTLRECIEKGMCYCFEYYIE